MVHALKEAHRVLIPKGTMIDVRPLSIDVPLEVVYEGGYESAGLIDMSPGSELDRAADAAIESVLMDRFYEESMLEYFDYTYNWTTIEGMEEDLEENWKDEVNLPLEVSQRAHLIFDQHRQQAKIRVPARMKLGKYVKLP